MTQFDGTPEGRWSSDPQQQHGYQSQVPTSPQPVSSGARQIPWGYIIWGVGLIVLLLGLLIVGHYDDPSTGVDQMVIASMQTRDRLTLAGWVLPLTGLAWIIYRIVSSVRSGK